MTATAAPTDHRLAFTPWSIERTRRGEKTQTRRLIVDSNSQGNYRASELMLADPRTFVDGGPSPAGNPGPYLHAHLDVDAVCRRRGWKREEVDPAIVERLYPRVFPGDRLLALESARGFDIDGGTFRIEYRDGDHKLVDMNRPDPTQLAQAVRLARRHPRWQTPRFMPRWAVRFFFEVVEVRAQRIQEISEDDAVAEGCNEWRPCSGELPTPPEPPLVCARCGAPRGTVGMVREARADFVALWDRLHPGSWERNDWVWVYSFKAKEGARA
jgi:hypothetical protein